MQLQEKIQKSTHITESLFKSVFVTHYDEVRDYIQRTCNDRELSEEIAQEAFVRLWSKRDHICVPLSWSAFMKRLAKNILYDSFRARKVREQYANTVRSKQTEPSYDLYNEADENKSELVARLHTAIDQLRPKTRSIFLMNRQRGLSAAEISEELNIPKRTVDYQIALALKTLRTMAKRGHFRMEDALV